MPFGAGTETKHDIGRAVPTRRCKQQSVENQHYRSTFGTRRTALGKKQPPARHQHLAVSLLHRQRLSMGSQFQPWDAHRHAAFRQQLQPSGGASHLCRRSPQQRHRLGRPWRADGTIGTRAETAGNKVPLGRLLSRHLQAEQPIARLRPKHRPRRKSARRPPQPTRARHGVEKRHHAL